MTTLHRAVGPWDVAALGALVGLTLLVVVGPDPLPGEIGWVHALQRLGEPVPTVAGFVGSTTGTEGALVAALIPIGWLLRRGGRPGWAVVGIVLAATLVVQPVFKELIDRPRPSEPSVEVRADHDSASFPSGHSLSTTGVYGSAAVALRAIGKRRWAVVATLPILLTFLAGGVLGVHWPSDAMAGTLVGALTVRLTAPPLLAALR